MELKKTFVVFLAYIAFVFVLMLTTSYAWYSFSNGSTTFEAVTGDRDRDIVVMYDSGSHINTTTAIPINSSDSSVFPSDADRTTFTVEVTNFANNDQTVVAIKLQNITIDTALKSTYFKYSLLYNGSEVANGNFSNVSSGNELVLKDNLTITKSSINNFELRLWIEDNGGDQSSMQNKTFEGTVAVTVMSR